MSGTVTNSPAEVASEQRRSMVRDQLERRGIRNSGVLRAMGKIPRERFMLPEYQGQAYSDGAFPIGEGQTISQPYIVAFMTEAMNLTGRERVLEIGTGSGYQAAVLAELAAEVYSIELVEPLSQRASRVLADLGYTNVKLKVGNGYEGWPEHAPFDAIVVTAAPPHIPDVLVRQLKKGGRMIVPVGIGYQELVLVTKTEDKIVERVLLPVRFVPMIDEKKDAPEN